MSQNIAAPESVDEAWFIKRLRALAGFRRWRLRNIAPPGRDPIYQLMRFDKKRSGWMVAGTGSLDDMGDQLVSPYRGSEAELEAFQLGGWRAVLVLRYEMKKEAGR